MPDVVAEESLGLIGLDVAVLLRNEERRPVEEKQLGGHLVANAAART
jgi:hypothetical protein